VRHRWIFRGASRVSPDAWEWRCAECAMRLLKSGRGLPDPRHLDGRGLDCGGRIAAGVMES
jgi:hypothetical protein